MISERTIFRRRPKFATDPGTAKEILGVGVFPGKPGPAVRVGRGKVPQRFQRPGPNGDQFGRHGAAYAAGQLKFEVDG